MKLNFRSPKWPKSEAVCSQARLDMPKMMPNSEPALSQEWVELEAGLFSYG